jgi:mannosyltransferase
VDRGRLRDLALVGVPALLATGLCLIQIDARSLGFDEAATVAIASEHGSALSSAVAHDGGNMSGYYLLLHALMAVFGHSLFVLRVPSAIAAGVATALTAVLALRLFDRRVAPAAGLLMAVNLPLVFWGQSSRSYAILVALSAGSFLAFELMLESSRPRAAWVAYVLCTALALYASIMAVLVVAAQVAALAWHRGRKRWMVTALLALAVCCVPIIILAARRGTGQLFWVSRPDLLAVKQVAESVTSAGLQPTMRPTSSTYPLLVATAALLVAAGVVVGRRRRWGPVLVLSWLVVPLAFAVVESFVGTSIFVPRNLVMVLPAVALLLGWALTRVKVGWPLLAAIIALRALQLGPAYGVSPENWRAATSYVLARSRAGDCIAFYPADGRNAFRYYAAGHAPRSVLPAVPWSYDRAYIENYATLTARPAGCVRLWLVSSHVGRPDGPHSSRANRARYLRLRAMLVSAYGPSGARKFGYADAVTVELFGLQRSGVAGRPGSGAPRA